MKSYKEEFVAFLGKLQSDICSAVEQEDGVGVFTEEKWDRDGGGGGKTRVLSGGKVIEKGGVNFSEVYGELPPVMQAYLNTKHKRFFASGVSLVIHPYSPLVPTTHANYRYFELYDDAEALVDQWFAGGADLTPYYVVEQDAIHFHSVQKAVCDQFDPSFYPQFKKACDAYFTNHHRGEGRGIGGTFFDYLRANDRHSADDWFAFTQAAGNAFIESYIPIVRRNKNRSFTPQQKEWQEIRRGRYVEFNLIHDKGTQFGLKTGGRVESILMTLPLTVRWEYNHTPVVGSEEEKLVNVLRSPKEWV